MDEALRAEVFGKKGQKLEDVYPIERFPLIWMSHVRVLLCRHGQTYFPVDGTKHWKEMEVETFRLKALQVSRARYPYVLLWSVPTFSNWKCPNLMGWTCFGDRPEGIVTDQTCQDNKQDFSEKNLEYVSRSVNAQRHHDFVRRGGVVVGEVAGVAPTIKVPGSGSRTLFMSNAPLTPDGGTCWWI